MACSNSGAAQGRARPVRASLARILGVVSILGAGTLAGTARAAEPAAGQAFSGEVGLVIWQGLVRGTGAQGANLVLDLSAHEGKWGRVWGTALGFNNGVHVGVVEEPRVDADSIRLRINMDIGSDQWVEGGPGVYEVELKREANGQLAGTYKGKFMGRDAAGKVTGEIKPARPVAAEFKPVEAGEHPRILFRKHELPALKERLKTPLGQAYLAQITKASDPVSLGMAYQLTGEKKYADQAMAAVTKGVRDPEEFTTDHGAGSGGWGHSLVQTAITYDLCFEAWPAAFRKEIDDRLLEVLPKLVRYVAVTSHANTHPCSNYYGPGHGAPAIASLVYLNDKGPEPAAPTKGGTAGIAVGTGTSAKTALQPVPDYTPGEGVPVVPLEPGKVLDRWLYAGPLPMKGRAETIGRNTPTKVQLGTHVKYGILKDGKPQVSVFPFSALDAKEYVGAKGVEVEKLLGKAGATTGLFFATVKVEQEQSVAPAVGRADAVMLIDGQTVKDGEIYKLAKGVHPVLVVLATDAAKGTLAPRFAGGTDATMGDAVRRDMALLALDREAWQTAGLDAAKQNIIDVGYRKNYLHYRWGIGDGGFQAETGSYAMIASWLPLNYAVAYYKTHGRNASPYPDVTHLMVRRMMQVQFRDDGTEIHQKLNSVAGFDTKWVAAAFPIIPDKYKPAVLWGWNKMMGVTDEKTTPRLLGGPRAGLGGMEAAHVFLHYPLDMKPEHPSKVMPLEWEAPTFGFEAFRSGWNAKDDFIGQAFAKAHIIGGWNHPNAGTFRLLGLNHEWVTGSTVRVGFRVQEPCVILPDDTINEGACGRVAYRKVEADGSAVLTIDLQDVYSSPKSRLYDGNLLRIGENFQDSGISGLRAMAFDYSGKSGAPCLFVLVDKISGGGKREWLWPLPEGALARTKTSGNTFTIDYGDASLKATFVTPSEVKVQAVGEEVAIGKLGDKHRSFEGRLERIKATVPSGDIFVVATVQKKDAPAVNVTGSGLGAAVTVGGQTVSFDGEKVVLKP